MKQHRFAVMLVLSVAFVTGMFIAQPALAGCSACAALRERAQANSVNTLSAADTLAGNMMNGTALNQSVQAIRRASESAGIDIDEAASIVGSRISEGIRERIGPVIERISNRTVYRLNNTPVISIARTMRLTVRPVETEQEHIRVNGISLIVHNITNPALQVQLRIERNGSVIERNMTITRTRDRNRLNLTIRNATAMTDAEVIYDNGTIYISKLNKTIELKSLPDRIKQEIRERWQERAEIREMKIEAAQDRLRYVIRTRTRKRILGLFDADVDEEHVVDADTAGIESTTGPWWGFLAW